MSTILMLSHRTKGQNRMYGLHMSYRSGLAQQSRLAHAR